MLTDLIASDTLKFVKVHVIVTDYANARIKHKIARRGKATNGMASFRA